MKIGLSKETKVALLTIVSGTMLYTGFNFLKGRDTFSSTTYYKIVYKNVTGLAPGNPVQINGVPVGQVKEMVLNKEHMVEVIIQVEGDPQLTDSTHAVLADGGLLGGKSILLEIKPGSRILKDGDQIKAFAEPGLTQALMDKAKPVMEKVDKTLTNVNTILGPDNQKHMAEVLTNLATLTAQMNKVVEMNKVSIAASMNNINKLTASLVETEKQLKPVLHNLNAFSDSLKDAKLKSTVAQVNQTMANLNETITNLNKGKGSAGKFLKDDSLYAHLDKSVKDMDKLFLDMKARPGRYVHFSVFGKKDKQSDK